MVSMNDIAKKLNISRCTVSNILNNKLDKYKYSDDTVKKVRKTAKELNYVSNNLARSLKTNKTGTLGVVVADITNPFYSQCLKHMETLCYDRDINLIICASNENIEKETRILNMLQSRMIDGLMMSPVSYDKSLQQDYPFPIVLFDRTVKGNKHPTITIDNSSASEHAVQELIDGGKKRIAFIGSNSQESSVQERLHGYKSALKNNGIKFIKKNVELDVLDDKDAYLACKRILNEQDGHLDAIFTSTHFLSAGIAKALQEIPNTVSNISGFDALPGLEFLPLDVSVITQPHQKIAESCLKTINQKTTTKKNIVLKTNLKHFTQA